MMSDDGTFGGEAFGVFGFFFQIGEGDEEGEVSVLMTCFFETGVELLLDVFPDAVTPRFDNHAAPGF